MRCCALASVVASCALVAVGLFLTAWYEELHDARAGLAGAVCVMTGGVAMIVSCSGDTRCCLEHYEDTMATPLQSSAQVV